MAEQRIALITVITAASLCGACRGTANSPASPTPGPSSATAQSASDKAIETEIVSAGPIAGVVVASGKILVPEDRTAIIGPVNEGRIVRLYAGQGSRVRKGQRLAELESADIDQAEADYLKALADAENARRSAAAELKLAQQTYDRTKSLYEKTVGSPGTELEFAL